eukprot:COSAG02_NODE_6338_length_3640_cov_3.068060_2_plen_264_part_00
MIKKGQVKPISTVLGDLGVDFSFQLRDIRTAPNFTSPSTPSIKFLAYEFWDKQHGRKGTSGAQVSVLDRSRGMKHKEMLEGYGSKWSIEWEVPVDIDMKVDYSAKGKLTPAAMKASVSVAMRKLVVKGEMWLFLQPHGAPDGVKSVVVHFEDKPAITWQLGGEARTNGGATAGVLRLATKLAGTDIQIWDRVVKFVEERVDKEIAVHVGSSAVSYPVKFPSDESGEEHYEACALFRTNTVNSSVVTRSPFFSDILANSPQLAK